MVRSTDSIERDIATARDQLAEALDRLSAKVDPQRLVDDTKHAVIGTVRQPKVLIPAIAFGAAGALLLGRTLFRAVLRR